MRGKSSLDDKPLSIGQVLTDQRILKPTGTENSRNLTKESYVFGSIANISRLPVANNTNDNIEQNDKKFKQERLSDNWRHGCKLPFQAVELRRLKESSKVQVFNDPRESELFEPRIVMKQVENETYNKKQVKENPDTQAAYKLPEEVITQNDRSQGFSGNCTLPVVNLKFSKDERVSGQEIPMLTYPTTHEMNGNVYTFGGLMYVTNNDMRYYGIPSDTDLNKISVYLACELPPHLNKDIIMNPFMIPNPYLYMRSSATGTYNFVKSSEKFKHPSHLCSMVACTISETQAFLYGGFKVSISGVKYHSESGRWIIEKDISLNEEGYIFDTFDLSFRKISLVTRKGSKLTGRIGTAMETGHTHSAGLFKTKSPQSTSSPPVFADNNSIVSLDSYQRQSASNSNSGSHYSPRPLSLYPLNSSFSINQESKSPSNESVLTLENPSVSIDKISQLDNDSPTLTSMNSIPKKSVDCSSKTSRSNTPTPTQSNSGVSKVVNALGKSKIFHRQHSKSTSMSYSASTNSSSLKNTYYKQVKDIRSNSTNSNGPVSPNTKVTSPIPISTKPTVSRINTEPTIIKKSPTNYETDLKFDVRSPLGTPYLQSSSEPSSEDCKETSPFWKGKSTTMTLNEEYPLKISVFIFGGFVAETDDPIVRFFKASNEFFRIDLNYRSEKHNYYEFEDSAFTHELSNKNIFSQKDKSEIGKDGASSETKSSDPKNLWPSPRGYFAYSLIDVNPAIEDRCQVNLYKTDYSNDTVIDESGEEENNQTPSQYDSVSPSSHSSSLSGIKESLINLKKNSKSEVEQSFLNGKALLIQGGCNENGEVFSDFYLYMFQSGTWQTLSTYAYDYFGSESNPSGDVDSKIYTENMVTPEGTLIEAELRACHHQSLYYTSDDRDFLFFFGGVNNDYLRLFDKVPYKSDKFDVSRISKFQFATSNNFISRILVLNLQTQTWRFLRYNYNFTGAMDESFIKQVAEDPSWINARMCSIGGSLSLIGKSIILANGLLIPVPEQKSDAEHMRKQFQSKGLFNGGQFTWSFPSV